MNGPSSEWKLEICQFVVPGFVGLIAGQGQGLVFVRETLENSKVHKLIVVNLNLERRGVGGWGWKAGEGQAGPVTTPPPAPAGPACMTRGPG